jgi:hypothetical protein
MTTSVTDPLLEGSEPYEDVMRAVMPLLTELLDDVDVYDFVPENAEPPYVTWNTGWLAERDSLNGTADRLWFQIDVWSSYRGYREASRIARRIVRRMHHAELLIDGYSPVHVLREQSHQTRDPDGRHRRLALTFFSPYVSPRGG